MRDVQSLPEHLEQDAQDFCDRLFQNEDVAWKFFATRDFAWKDNIVKEHASPEYYAWWHAEAEKNRKLLEDGIIID